MAVGVLKLTKGKILLRNKSALTLSGNHQEITWKKTKTVKEQKIRKLKSEERLWGNNGNICIFLIFCKYYLIIYDEVWWGRRCTFKWIPFPVLSKKWVKVHEQFNSKNISSHGCRRKCHCLWFLLTSILYLSDFSSFDAKVSWPRFYITPLMLLLPLILTWS